MKYYLAGPMAGIPDRNFPMFAAAATFLRDRGFTVLSPAELNKEYLNKGRSVCMRRDIEFVMQADGIFMLPGWRESQGALCEFAVATQLGLATSRLIPLENRKFEILDFVHSERFKLS